MYFYSRWRQSLSKAISGVYASVRLSVGLCHMGVSTVQKVRERIMASAKNEALKMPREVGCGEGVSPAPPEEESGEEAMPSFDLCHGRMS